MIEQIFNILLDEKPYIWNGYPVNTGFRVGIQLQQALMDGELSDREKMAEIQELLFPGAMPESEEEITAIIEWYLNGWSYDKHSKAKSSKVKSIDFDVDQWRIYSAFRLHYNIDLNTADMHYWEFMGLLTTLEECAFTRVVDIRTKKIDPKMSRETKKAIVEAKEIYNLEQTEEKESPEEALKRMEAVEAFNRLRGGL